MSVSRDRIVEIARAWLGTPYHHQASLKGVGCDCLGLVRGVYREAFGAEPEAMPPYTPDWAEGKAAETLLLGARRHLRELTTQAAKPGDILVFQAQEGSYGQAYGNPGDARHHDPRHGTRTCLRGSIWQLVASALRGLLHFSGS